jgi:hypothetical protein
MTGREVAIDIPWYETRILNCTFCGKMIAGHYWHDDAYPSDKLCEPACADVKRRLVGEPRRKTASRQRKRT